MNEPHGCWPLFGADEAYPSEISKLRATFEMTDTMKRREALKAMSIAEASKMDYGYNGGISPEALHGFQCGI